MQIRIQQGWAGARESAFLKDSLVMLKLLVCGPQLAAELSWVTVAR